jgi:hypothetical protein
MPFPYSASSSAAIAADDSISARDGTRSGARTTSRHFEDMSAASATLGSAVSWSAIFAGAAAASALSLILLILGTGLGLSSVSPWASAGMGAAVFGVSTILWVTCTQVIASGMGGYLAGRLRTKHVSIHNDEVYFRDTAHGFLAWAIATLLTASLLASAVGTVVGAGGVSATAATSPATSAASTIATVGATAATPATSAVAANNGAANSSGSAMDPVSYMMDSMFRKSGSGVSAATDVTGGAGAGIAVASTAEITGIFMNSIKQGVLPPDDAKYVAAAVASRTGVSPDEAEARVKATYDRMQIKLRDAEASARQAADTTRKATAYGALWLFVSLLIGAFFASWGATFGGRHRDI